MIIGRGRFNTYSLVYCFLAVGSFSGALTRHSLSAEESYAKQVGSSNIKLPVTLITFDVDGTLVKGTSTGSREVTAHSKAFMHAADNIYAGDVNFGQKYSTPLDIIPANRYHGCTDGLIMLNIVKYAFGIPAEDAVPKLKSAFQSMYDYIAKLADEEVSSGIRTLPGVQDHLHRLATDPVLKQHTLCGLVTGNVEGIARKKMRACQIFQTGVFAPPAKDQHWEGENSHAFLGGFGSDYCSGDIEDSSRIYKDRGEQIAIAYQRALSLLTPQQEIVRVVHVGDAPADILAAKWCSEERKFGSNVCVGCVGVATGNYSPEQLQELKGTTIPGLWEPIVLADGMNDPKFIEACGIVVSEQLSETKDKSLS